MRIFRVSTGFWSHPKADVGNAALGLWVRAGSYVAQHSQDGYVPRRMVTKLGGRKRDAEALVQAGLWERADDGYRFHEWDRHQPTKSATEARRRADADRQARRRAKGSLVDNPALDAPDAGPTGATVVDAPQDRHASATGYPQSAGEDVVSRRDSRVTDTVTPHPAEDGSRHVTTTDEGVLPGDELASRRDTGVTPDASTSDQSSATDAPQTHHAATTGDGLFPGDELASRRDTSVTSRAYAQPSARVSFSSSTCQVSLEEEKTQRAGTAAGARPPSRNQAEQDAQFRRFYDAYPRKKEPKRARKAWDIALRDGADPEAVIAGAERFRDACRAHGTDPYYIKHPATWINAGCWDDEADPIPAASGGYQGWRNPDPSAYETEEL